MEILKIILFIALFMSYFYLMNIAIFSYASDDSGLSSTSQINENNTSIVKVGNMTLNVLLAQTPSDQSKGLAIKEFMKENEGMLFIFDTPNKHSFWMKDMKFPIDIIWIDTEGKIVHIERNLEPCFFLLPCPSHTPKYDSLYVLEVVSNFTNKFNVNVGDRIELEPIISNTK